MKNLNAMNAYVLCLGSKEDFYREPEEDELIIITDTENIYIGKYIGNLQIKTLDKIIDIDEYSIWMPLYNTSILKPSEDEVIQKIKNFAMIQIFLCIIQEGLDKEYNKEFGVNMICLSTIIRRENTNVSLLAPCNNDMKFDCIFPVYSFDEKCHKLYSKKFEIPSWVGIDEIVYESKSYIDKCIEYFKENNKKIE